MFEFSGGTVDLSFIDLCIIPAVPRRPCQGSGCVTLLRRTNRGVLCWQCKQRVEPQAVADANQEKRRRRRKVRVGARAGSAGTLHRADQATR